MPMWAYVYDGQVRELTDVDPVGRFTPDMEWVDCTSVTGIAEGWLYSNATFEPPGSVVPPVDTQAQDELSNKINQGITITCTGTPAISAVYALDDDTLTEINSLAISANAGLGFPGGGNTFAYPDKSGQPRVFDTAHMVSLFKSMRDLVWQLKTQAAIMKNGGTAAWPSQSVTIP